MQFTKDTAKQKKRFNFNIKKNPKKFNKRRLRQKKDRNPNTKHISKI